MELIKGYLAGSAGDFECLYNRYRKQLYAYLNTLLEEDKAKADDVFQQTWLKVIDHLPQYRNQDVFLAYLMRIAHNAAMDLLRKKQRREKFEFSASSFASLPHNNEPAEYRDNENIPSKGDERYMPGKNMEQRELAWAIDQAVNELNSEMKEVFLLRMESLSFKEIAEIQKCSINTVLARMQYALKKLRISLKEWKNDL